uniref:Uncharacterized protein n=1 Tax=Heterorhabditis bacteriophora TaxID=37862 RepID=A0A1I7WSS5_HETBA
MRAIRQSEGCRGARESRIFVVPNSHIYIYIYIYLIFKSTSQIVLINLHIAASSLRTLTRYDLKIISNYNPSPCYRTVQLRLFKYPDFREIWPASTVEATFGSVVGLIIDRIRSAAWESILRLIV